MTACAPGMWNEANSECASSTSPPIGFSLSACVLVPNLTSKPSAALSIEHDLSARLATRKIFSKVEKSLQ